MVAEKNSIHPINLERRIKGLKKWKIDEKEKKDIIRFLQELELGKVNPGKKISLRRQAKYLDSLKVPLEYFGKHSSKLTMADMEAFERDLSSDKIKSKLKKKPFAHETKVDIKRALKIYLKWQLGEEKGHKFTKWFDLRVPQKTPAYLSELEVEKLFKAATNAHERFLIAVLFDSGARAEEFHNIRYEDIQMPTGEVNHPKVTLKAEYSKTEGRVVGLYWKYSLDAVKEFLDERIRNGIRSEEVLFDKQYNNSRKILQRLGKKILSRSIHYHLFRHSSATHYAKEFNHHELCYRYGWKFSSNMPDIYISRSGMMEIKAESKFSSTKIQELQSKIEKRDEEYKILKEKMDSQSIMMQNQIEEAFKQAEEKMKFLVEKESRKIRKLGKEEDATALSPFQ